MKRVDIMETPRDSYTLDGGSDIEQRIAMDQELIAKRVRQAVPARHFTSLVLMGGYGRGEGGYTMHDGVPAPYNDYDYFLVVKSMTRKQARRLQQELQPLAHQLSNEVGIEVDLAVLRKEQLSRLPKTLMNAEMQWGHSVIAGDQQVLTSMPEMPIDDLARGEFVRLLNNRGSLLLLNARQLSSKGDSMNSNDREIFFKYLFKAVLACGDALLAANDRYHPSYMEKLARIQSLEELPVSDFIEMYQEAVDQKFHPDHQPDSHQDLIDWQNKVVDCWLKTLSYFESRRLGTEVPDWNTYASASIPKGQLESSAMLRNILITVRDYGLSHGLRHLRWSLRYPRERLIAVLPGLLTYVNHNLDMPDKYLNILGINQQSNWSETVDHYLDAWSRYA